MHAPLFTPVASPYLVPFDGSFDLARAATRPVVSDGKSANVNALAEAVSELSKLQQRLYARNQHGVLLVFQAMDAAGKDGTIRAVLSGVNPQGCQVTSFKAPSSEELAHDFLWRVQKALPGRGMIGVWNRSHYEEVLVVRVHPEYLEGQRLPRRLPSPQIWEERLAAIAAAEQHWAQAGYVVLKFFLHVSQREQHERFLARLDDPEDHWKFNPGDLAESARWTDYMDAYQAALASTSRAYAPWYAIPADSKSYMRRTVADIVVQTLAQLDLRYPPASPAAKAAMAAARAELEASLRK